MILALFCSVTGGLHLILALALRDMLQANVVALATIRREMEIDIFGFQEKN